MATYAYKFVHAIAPGRDDTKSITYHFQRPFEQPVQSYSVQLYVYALQSNNAIWSSSVKLARVLTITAAGKNKFYFFTGRNTGSEMEYYQIGEYNSSTVDKHFLDSGQSAIVYTNDIDSMAVLVQVDITNESATDQMFIHEIPLVDIPGWSNVTRADLGYYAEIPQAEKDRRLVNAAERGYTMTVKSLLMAGANPQALNVLALKLAVQHGHTDVVKILLANGANPNNRSAKDTTPLMAAVETNNSVIAAELIAHGADVHVENDIVLFRAIVNGNINIVKILLAGGADIHDMDDRALEAAVREGNMNIIKLLLVHSTTHTPYAPHMLRSFSNRTENPEIRQMLLDYIPGDYSGLSQAAKNGLFMEVAQNGNLAQVKQLLINGGDINIDKALIYAAHNGHLEVVKVLLEAGANVHIDNDKAFRKAAKDGHTEVVKLLLTTGANVHAKKDYALRNAAKNCNVEIVEILLAHGANAHNADNLALRLAVIQNHTEVVRVLLKHSLTHIPYTRNAIDRILPGAQNPEIRQLLENYV
jgi:ankyrin repeat protein